MQPLSDAQRLRDYAERGAEAAFAEIVVRHTDLVYSAALRQVYSSDLARDVTQSVFTDLARKAGAVSANLSPEASLVGWLYRGTRFAARDLYRNETRRTQRERQAMEQLHPAPETPPDWEHLRPVLDEAMSELDDTDRDAVLLRYFKNHDLRTVGATLGISDDAAQKRVSRAVERLREFFAKRGVTVGASGLVVVISANAVQAAPAGLALTISTAAIVTGTTLATTATVTATKAIAMTTFQKSIVTATIAVLAGVGIYEARHAAHLRTEVQTLQQQQQPLTGQIQQLRSERDSANNELALLADEIQKLKSNSTELLKLRGEVGVLRADKNRVHDSATNQPAPVSVSRWTPQQLTNAGSATPLDTLQTILWAASTGNGQAVSTNLSTSLADFGLRSESENLRLVRVVGQGSPEFKVLSERKISETRVQLDVEQKVGAYRFLKTFNLQLYGNAWMVEGSESPEGLNPHLDF
ncbi:MAG: sigma-70 family RNA polymerase sigma factor [Verrucomicrobiota bacterium]